MTSGCDSVPMSLRSQTTPYHSLVCAGRKLAKNTLQARFHRSIRSNPKKIRKLDNDNRSIPRLVLITFLHDFSYIGDSEVSGSNYLIRSRKVHRCCPHVSTEGFHLLPNYKIPAQRNSQRIGNDTDNFLFIRQLCMCPLIKQLSCTFPEGCPTFLLHLAPAGAR